MNLVNAILPDYSLHRKANFKFSLQRATLNLAIRARTWFHTLPPSPPQLQPIATLIKWFRFSSHPYITSWLIFNKTPGHLSSRDQNVAPLNDLIEILTLFLL